MDLTALNLSPVLEAPIRNIVPNLVYAATGHEVKTVMVAGRVLVRDGVVLTADEEAVRAEAQEQAEDVAQCTGEWHCWGRWRQAGYKGPERNHDVT